MKFPYLTLLFWIFSNLVSQIAAANPKLCSQIFLSSTTPVAHFSIDNSFPQEVLKAKLLKGAIESYEVIGKGNFGAHFVRYKDGTEGIWKANYKHSLFESARSEIAAFRIDRFLGLNRVPITVEKSLNNVEGTVQYRIKNLKELPPDRNYSYAPDELGFFDYLISNGDRRGDNILVTTEGYVVAIDNGMGFIPGQGKVAFERFQYGVNRFIQMLGIQKEVEERLRLETQAEQIKLLQQGIKRNRTDQQIMQLSFHAFVPSRTIVERLRNTTYSDWKNLIGDLLSDAQLQELLNRQQNLINAIDFAVEHLGAERVYSAGLNSPLLKLDE